jgi:hypothetical protein
MVINHLSLPSSSSSSSSREHLNLNELNFFYFSNLQAINVLFIIHEEADNIKPSQV